MDLFEVGDASASGKQLTVGHSQSRLKKQKLSNTSSPPEGGVAPCAFHGEGEGREGGGLFTSQANISPSPSGSKRENTSKNRGRFFASHDCVKNGQGQGVRGGK